MQITRAPITPLKQTGLSSDKSDGKLKKACHDFEAIVLRQLLTDMRKSVPKTGLLDSGYAQDMYQSMQDDALVQALASGRGTGLADELYAQITSQMHSAGKG